MHVNKSTNWIWIYIQIPYAFCGVRSTSTRCDNKTNYFDKMVTLDSYMGHFWSAVVKNSANETSVRSCLYKAMGLCFVVIMLSFPVGNPPQIMPNNASMH